MLVNGNSGRNGVVIPGIAGVKVFGEAIHDHLFYAVVDATSTICQLFQNKVAAKVVDEFLAEDKLTIALLLDIERDGFQLHFHDISIKRRTDKIEDHEVFTKAIADFGAIQL